MVSSPTYQIGSWAAGDTGLADGNGTLWGVNQGGTAGIFDGPDVRLNQSVFPNADGGLRSRNYRPPRTITLAGWASGVNGAGAEASRQQFAGLLAGGGQSTLTVTYIDGLAVTATVELAGIPKATPVNQDGFNWQLTMSAVDPFLYGLPMVSSTGLPSSSGGLDWSSGGGLNWSSGGGLNWGTVSSLGLIMLTNSGYEDAWPVFTITGPITNPVITNTTTGQVLAYTDVLGASDTVVLTSSPINRAVTKNGAPFRVNLTTAQWFSVPAQGSIAVNFQGVSVGSPQLSASWSNVY
jgi:hypothetical protein